MSENNQNGKGDKPRNLGRKFRENYELIDWGHKSPENRPKLTRKDVKPRN